MVRVLVPVEILEGETVGPGIVDLLAPAEVVLLGYHVIPEQTSPGQARMSFEERAQTMLADVAEVFEDAGAAVTTRLVFTHDAAQSFERVATETESDVLVRLNPAMGDDDVLVALHGAVAAERIGRIVAELVAGRDVTVHLLEVAGPDADALNLLDRAETALREGGVDPGHIDSERVRTETPIKAIATAASGMDAIVLGERAPSWREFVFGGFEERIADAALGVVMVVRAGDDAADDEATGAGADES